jgi:hypothetical protein
MTTQMLPAPSAPLQQKQGQQLVRGPAAQSLGSWSYPVMLALPSLHLWLTNMTFVGWKQQ